MLADEVGQAAGRGDDDVRARGERARVRARVEPADDDRHVHAGAGAQGHELVPYLKGELARRREDQGVDAVRVGGEALQERQRKGRRFPAPRLRHAHRGAAGQDGGDAGALDGGWGGHAQGSGDAKSGGEGGRRVGGPRGGGRQCLSRHRLPLSLSLTGTASRSAPAP